MGGAALDSLVSRICIYNYFQVDTSWKLLLGKQHLILQAILHLLAFEYELVSSHISRAICFAPCRIGPSPRFRAFV